MYSIIIKSECYIKAIHYESDYLDKKKLKEYLTSVKKAWSRYMIFFWGGRTKWSFGYFIFVSGSENALIFRYSISANILASIVKESSVIVIGQIFHIGALLFVLNVYLEIL